MTAWTSLVSVEQLADEIDRDKLIVLDARFKLDNPAGAEDVYRESHLPGARFADLDRDLSDHERKGGRHPWPGAAQFTDALGRWGITPEHQVVVYDAGDGALAAARAWFMLQALGHRNAAVLDGGWLRWIVSGLPVESGVPHPRQASYEGEFDNDRLLDAEQVQAHLDAGGLLIDARAAERFRGEIEPLDRAPGHVPGAVNRPYSANLRDSDHRDVRFKPAAQLKAEFEALIGAHPPEQVAVMCGSGVTACHHLLAMAHAGLPGGKLFTGSWSGWLEDPERPIAKG